MFRQRLLRSDLGSIGLRTNRRFFEVGLDLLIGLNLTKTGPKIFEREVKRDQLGPAALQFRRDISAIGTDLDVADVFENHL